jgi:hypothetical protein
LGLSFNFAVQKAENIRYGSFKSGAFGYCDYGSGICRPCCSDVTEERRKVSEYPRWKQ